MTPPAAPTHPSTPAIRTALSVNVNKVALVRNTRHLGIPYNPPSRFPLPTQNAARAYYWLHGQDCALARRFAHAVYRAFFVDDLDISSPDTVLDIATRLGIDRHFSAQFGLEHIRFAPKPSPHGFRAVLSRLRARPGQSWMIEDSADNLKTAKRLGLNTVWLAPGEPRRPAYVDHRLNRLSDLVRLVR